MPQHVVILGGGLAGLSCAYELTKAGVQVTVLEREEQVGGMAASFVEDGDEYWSHDFGPHRFHTLDGALKDHVKEILGGNYVPAKRLSRARRDSGSSPLLSAQPAGPSAAPGGCPTPAPAPAAGSPEGTTR